MSFDEAMIASLRHTGTEHEISAAKPFAFWQTFSLGLMAGGATLGLWHYPIIALNIIGTVITFILTIITILKCVILVSDFFKPIKSYQTKTLIADEDLPIYSVLIPLYREENIIFSLLERIDAIDYPRDKLDVIILLEADDEGTVRAMITELLRRKRPEIRLLIIPDTYPRTKPKAMNVALPYMQGQYFVIYDAEDRPDKMQLRKVVTAFQELPADVGAIQARLTFFNYNRNLLTRMFTIEYDIWFHHFLPGLVRLGLPVPLAGTSTHMRTSDIQAIGGWDAHNVTEDCDLGMRLARGNMHTVIVDSDTFEEATIAYYAWIKQRTRWIKGYMQTQAVHTSRFFHDISAFGIYKFLGMCVVVGGQVLSALLHPIAIGLFLYQICADYFLFDALFHPKTKPLIMFLLISGTFLPVLQAILVYTRLQKRVFLIKFSVFHLFYWFLAAIASYRALWQLVTSPSYWEKTTHGIDTEHKED